MGYGTIKTTLTKAKELRPFVEKLITTAKRKNIHIRRIISAKLGNNCKEVKQLVDIIAPQFNKMKGGYIRIIKMGFRYGDAAPMALIEFTKIIYEKNKI